MGSELNGSYGGGVGLSYESTTGRRFTLECRYHHISNGSLRDPNVPLNALRVFFRLE